MEVFRITAEEPNITKGIESFGRIQGIRIMISSNINSQLESH